MPTRLCSPSDLNDIVPTRRLMQGCERVFLGRGACERAFFGGGEPVKDNFWGGEPVKENFVY